VDCSSRERRCNAALWHDLNCAELLEVMVERESLSDSELLDNNLARAVGEAPVLVGETLKSLPGAFEIRLGNLMDFRNTIAKEPRPK
jgi:hypothetical protein